MHKFLRSPALLFFLVLAVSIFIGNAAPAKAASTLAMPKGPVLLTLSGKISNTNVGDSAQFDRNMLEALGMRQVKTSTPWTDGVTTFEGALVSDVLAAAGAHGKEISATAIDDYAVSIPISDFTKYGVIIALKINGKYIRVREKGPLWIIYPLDENPKLKQTVIFERSIWQLNKIIVK